MKKKIVLGSLLFCLLLLSGSMMTNKTAAAAKDDPSPLLATWSIVISAPGQDLVGTMKIDKDGDALKGSVLTDLGEAPLKNIKITDNTFTADITVNVQGQTMEGTISGKLEEAKLSGEISLPGLGSINYTGKKPDSN